MPSVDVSTSFLNDLGKIIEKEVRILADVSSEKINKETQKVEQNAQKLSFLKTQEEKADYIRQRLTYVQQKFRPDYRIRYAIEFLDEIYTLQSMEELLDCSISSSKIKKVALSVSFGSDENVSIDIALGGESGKNKCILSSSNEASLLKTKQDIQGTFERSRLTYSWIYAHPVFLVITVLALPIPLLFPFWHLLRGKVDSSVLSFLSFVAYFLLVYLLPTIFKYFYPSNLFSISTYGKSSKPLKYLSGVILLGLLVNFVYDLLKRFL